MGSVSRSHLQLVPADPQEAPATPDDPVWVHGVGWLKRSDVVARVAAHRTPARPPETKLAAAMRTAARLLQEEPALTAACDDCAPAPQGNRPACGWGACDCEQNALTAAAERRARREQNDYDAALTFLMGGSGV